MNEKRGWNPLVAKTIEGNWRSFLGKAVNKDATSGEIESVKMAFYGGAAAVLAMIGEGIESGVTDREDANLLSRINQELLDYAETVRKGLG